MLLSLRWFLVQEPLPDSECIKSSYGIGFCTIDSYSVKLLKALCSKGLKCTFTVLARWANLAHIDRLVHSIDTERVFKQMICYVDNEI